MQKTKVVYINARNEQVVLSNPPLFVTKLEGVSGLDCEMQSVKSPYQDGVTYLGTLLPFRTITIEGAVLPKKLAARMEARRTLLRIFSPKLGLGQLRITQGNTTRVISVNVDKAPTFPDNRQTPYLKFLISLIAPNPFWLDPMIRRQDMADWIGGLRFPLMLPTMFAGRSTRTNTVVKNEGDVPTPVIITFNGGAVNPKIIHVDSGAFVQVRRTIETNEALIINTEFGHKQVLLRNNETGEMHNAFAYIDPASDFFSLHVGDNQLNFTSDEGTANTLVQVQWQNRYLGI